ncbi:snake venom 5'-nucleotidase-like [Rhipicephalus sanguineus]|uniref:snake venom 5'-nucleotidase-like n=1 Tax=Rhipicephalus sanguineus TaxID=34632 RepID=UPI001892FCD1|nr:snake venom 5'-nucleotidase-like [Rhipicephalus sanguineus]
MRCFSATAFVLFLCCHLRHSARDNGAQGSAGLQLTILHTNDIHSHIVPSSKDGGLCTANKSQCYGGVARITHKVKELKKNHKNAMFMNAGDFYQGTAWYNILKYNIVSAVMEKMGYDYVCLGNHEFDDGPKGLAPFLLRMQAANISVINTNADFSKEDALKNITLPKSVTKIINGTKIGIVGAVLHETRELSSPGNVTFSNDLESIRNESRKLAQNGTQIIIAITHIGYLHEMEIAAQVEEVDIVVGGHTNTFLYHVQTFPGGDKIEGDYPTVVNKTSGNGQALVVQDFWFGKYLGFLQVTFDANGNVTNWTGNPILINGSVEEDEEVLNITLEFEPLINKSIADVIGYTKVLLEEDGDICRLRECNLGNLLTDAYYSHYVDKSTSTPAMWSDVNAAVLNGGSIRAPIEQGNITLGDIMQTAPFGQTIVIVTLYGYELKNMFEHSVGNYSFLKKKGEFLQVSGVRVVYNLTMPPNSRVVSVHILCTNCTVPVYKPLEECEVYRVVTTDFVARGGDGFQKAKNVTDGGPLDLDVLRDYIIKISPVKTPVEGRITIHGNITEDPDAKKATKR